MHLSDFSPYPDGFSYDKTIDDIYSSIDNQTIAVMIELIQGEGGVSPFEKSQIQKLAQYLKSNDILLIVDEVQTGVYRTGEFLASNLFEIEPDIITLAKGLGGGVPIGVVMTKHKDIFKPSDHGSTFGGNFLSTRASLEVCDILQEYKSTQRLDKTIEYFDKKLSNLYQKFPDTFVDIVGIGLMRGLRVVDSEILSNIIDKSFQNGLLVLKAGQNTLRFLPPLSISNQEIDEGFGRLESAISSL
jgi:acetylornithine aminotransferase